MKSLSIIFMLCTCLISSPTKAQGGGKVSTRDFSFTVEEGISNYSVRIHTHRKINLNFNHSTQAFSNVRLLDSAGRVIALSPAPGVNGSSKTNCESPIFFASADRSISIEICKKSTALIAVPRKTVYTLSMQTK